MHYQEPAMEDNDNAEDDTNNRQEHKIRGLLFAGDKTQMLKQFYPTRSENYETMRAKGST